MFLLVLKNQGQSCTGCAGGNFCGDHGVCCKKSYKKSRSGAASSGTGCAACDGTFGGLGKSVCTERPGNLILMQIFHSYLISI